MSFPIQLMSVFEDAPLLRGSDERVTARVSTSSSTFRPMFIVGMTILVLCSLEKFGVSDLPDRREAKQTLSATLGWRNRGAGNFRARRGEPTFQNNDNSSAFHALSDPIVTYDEQGNEQRGTSSLVRKRRSTQTDEVYMYGEDKDVEMTEPGPSGSVHLSLLTACAPLGGLTFDYESSNVGARVTSKSMSNDFLFDRAKEMTQVRCGVYEVDVMLAPGEQFGFYLYPLGNTSDVATVSDIGCFSHGGERCPSFSTPAALQGMERCTKTYEEGEDIFYNRIFDGSTTTYVFGSCDRDCAPTEDSRNGCPSETAAES